MLHNTPQLPRYLHSLQFLFWDISWGLGGVIKMLCVDMSIHHWQSSTQVIFSWDLLLITKDHFVFLYAFPCSKLFVTTILWGCQCMVFLITFLKIYLTNFFIYFIYQPISPPPFPPSSSFLHLFSPLYASSISIRKEQASQGHAQSMAHQSAWMQLVPLHRGGARESSTENRLTKAN